MMCVNLNNIAILNIFRVDYFYIINGISKSEAITLLRKAEKWNITKRKKIIVTCKNG